jgi:hypothetical protein
VTEALKRAVQAFWDARCGTADVVEARAGTRDSFRDLDARRYALEPCIDAFAEFERQAGRRVLESAAASALISCASRKRTVVTGVDWSRRLSISRAVGSGVRTSRRPPGGRRGYLPFPDASFDVVYSWGVLRTLLRLRAVAEVLRVQAEARIMLYHRRSLFAMQAWTLCAISRAAVAQRELPCGSCGKSRHARIRWPPRRIFSAERASPTCTCAPC